MVVTERMLTGEITGIRKIQNAKDGACPVFEITVKIQAVPVRLNELRIEMPVLVEYDIGDKK